jgi:hypothetical protein
MERRTSAEITATAVAEAISVAGHSPFSVSKATDIPLSVLCDRLSGRSVFTVSELGRVGGFLCVSPANLFGVAA